MAKLNDLALVSTQRGMFVAPRGVQALVEHMVAMGFVADLAATEHDGYIEFKGVSGDFGHSLFYEGSRKGTPFQSFCLSFGSAPLTLGYGPKAKVHFFVEFVGTEETDVSEEFYDRVHTILYLFPQLVVAKHDPKRKR